jgi:hypothetical protein
MMCWIRQATMAIKLTGAVHFGVETIGIVESLQNPKP